MWVVKLGGSLAETPHLPRWLDALSQTGVIIVPGGGPFADAVRTAQARWRFDEATAHHMAILGMRQYGRMLAGLCPKLLMATTEEELASRPGVAKIWLPLPELLDEANIPASWGVTSDSLAAWVAGRLQAANLLLVKSVDLSALGTTPFLSRVDLVSRGWADPLFPAYAAQCACPSWLCGADGHRQLPQGFAEPARFFVWLHS